MLNKSIKSAVLLAFVALLFSSLSFATNDIYIDDIYQTSQPPWLKPKLTYVKNTNTKITFRQNFIDALPNKEALKLEDFERTVTSYEPRCTHEILGPSNYKKTYKDKKGVLWMVNSYPRIEDHIISGLYKLILGKFAPNEQYIVDKDGNINIGSEFIENFSPFAKLEYDYGKKCMAEYQCNGHDLKNISLVISAMILFEELNAHGNNVGIVCDEKGALCGMAKISHESTGLTPPKKFIDNMYTRDGKDMAKRNLKKLATSLSLITQAKDYYNDVLQNVDDLARSMENISAIPDELWQGIVEKRIGASKEVGAEITEENKNELIEKYMQIKKSSIYFAKCLHLEGAILRDNVEDIKKLMRLGLNMNDKYSYIQIDHDGSPLTPMEMATKAESQKVIEYLSSIST